MKMMNYKLQGIKLELLGLQRKKNTDGGVEGVQVPIDIIEEGE